MNNLQFLYDTDLAFMSIVDETAAHAIGSTSVDFAHEWLKMEHGSLENDGPSVEDSSDDTQVFTDSREKLEDDVISWCATFPTWKYADDSRKHVFGWLDRQAAITTRECIGDPGKAGLMGVVAHERECYEKQIAELQAQVDELKSRNCPHYHVREHYCDVHGTRIAELQAQVDNLAADLHTCNREREKLREQLGIALDHAHDMLALVDLDGEVVS